MVGLAGVWIGHASSKQSIEQFSDDHVVCSGRASCNGRGMYRHVRRELTAPTLKEDNKQSGGSRIF